MPGRALTEADLTGRDELGFLGPGGPVSRLIALGARGDRREEQRLRALPLAAWESEVLGLRQATIGPNVEAELGCPACDTDNLLIFAIADLPRATAPAADAPPEAPSEAPPEVALRSLTAGDVADLEASGRTGAAALAFLLARAGGLDETAATARLAGPDGPALTAALEGAAAGLGLDLATRCVECGADITAPFDVAAFVAAELAGRAERLLDEIHLIAATYHWSEAEILDLPYPRRQTYVARILRARALPHSLGAVA